MSPTPTIHNGNKFIPKRPIKFSELSIGKTFYLVKDDKINDQCEKVGDDTYRQFSKGYTLDPQRIVFVSA